MNIFRLDDSPEKAAQYHPDIYLSKLLTEAVQVLSTAIRANQPDINNDKIYKSTHIHHPCTIACANSREIFKWTFDLVNALENERVYRFNTGLTHKSWFVAYECFKNIDCIPDNKYDWPLAMPQIYKTNNPVESYRNYLINEKQRMKNGRWMLYYTRRGAPEWMPDWLKGEIAAHEKERELIF